MESSRLLDSTRDSYARSRPPPSMSLSTSLPSGQAYYTVESLEGASSLPLLKPGLPPAAASIPPDRDAILRLDAQTRALLADRETLDARARLLAAEREALLRRNVPAPSLAGDRRLDGLAPVDARLPLDARARLSLDELQALDPRARALPQGLDTRSRDALWPAVDSRARMPAAAGGLPLGAQDQRSLSAVGGLALGGQEHKSLSDIAWARELAAGARGGPYLPPLDPLHARRDIPDVRGPAMPLDSSFPRRDIGVRPSASSFRAQNERPFPGGAREPAGMRSAPPEMARKQSKTVTSVKAPVEKPKPKPAAPQQSEGWCAVCKIDCHNIKTLGIHVMGKKHKAMVEGTTVKKEEAPAEGKPAPATSQADRKRANDVKPETSQSAKRIKTTEGNGAASGTGNEKKGKADESKKEDKVKTPAAKAVVAKTPVTKNGKPDPSMPICEVCNIFTTGQKNLEIHLKGKKHAARVKELANNV